MKFYTYGNQMSRRHVQTEEGKVLCGAKGYLMDGGSAPYEYNGTDCFLLLKDQYSGRTSSFPVSIEFIVNCKKCRAALEKLVKE